VAGERRRPERVNDRGPSLVILAAGLGTRFGGDKQTVPLGPGGATLMEYTIHDALASGFVRVVVIVRAEMREAMQASLGGWLRGRVPFACAVQARDPARAKPWGTAHAVLAAAREVHGPFAVANADDLYGRAAFEAVARELGRARVGDVPDYALVGFPLRDTLSTAGSVNRGICEVDAAGMLTRIVERTELTRAAAEREKILDAPVSMNLWAFTPEVFAQLAEGFAAFRTAQAPEGGVEYLLPTAMQQLIDARRARVRVLPATGRWCGVTHAADAPRVREELAARVAHGEYPRDLWA
jgi:CTP:molybdopterin cytidylyltransferase MocA